MTSSETTAEVDGPAIPRSLPLPSRLFGRPVFYGWYIVALALASTMMGSGISSYGLGTFVRPMTEDLGWTRTDISFGNSLASAASGVIGLFLGGLIDRRGGRLLMIVGAAVGGAGFISLGLVRELWQYYIITSAFLTIGLAGMGSLTIGVVVSNWFIRRRGRAMAISVMGSSIGAFIVPSIATWLIGAFGWRAAWIVFGVAVWVVMIPAAALIMRRRPEDHGLLPDGGSASMRAPSALDQARTANDQVRWTRREAMRTPTLWMLIVAFGLGTMGTGALLLHLIPHLTDSGLSAGQAAFAFSMIGLAGLVSKPFWGLSVERFPTRLMAAAEFACLGLGVLLVMVSTSALFAALAVFVFGVGVGGILTVQETVWADYFGRVTLGTVRSVGRPFTIVFGASGPLLAGLAFDFRGSYRDAFALFIVSSIVAIVLVLLTPQPRHPATIEATST